MDARKQPGRCMCRVLQYACACATGCADLCRGRRARGVEGEQGQEGGETRCGTHSLSMGQLSLSLGREGNSAAVLNPANWRNSIHRRAISARSASPATPISLPPRRPLSIPPLLLSPPSFRRKGNLSLSPERCITRRVCGNIYGYESIFAMVISPKRLEVREPL